MKQVLIKSAIYLMDGDLYQYSGVYVGSRYPNNRFLRFIKVSTGSKLELSPAEVISRFKGEE